MPKKHRSCREEGFSPIDSWGEIGDWVTVKVGARRIPKKFWQSRYDGQIIGGRKGFWVVEFTDSEKEIKVFCSERDLIFVSHGEIVE